MRVINNQAIDIPHTLLRYLVLSIFVIPWVGMFHLTICPFMFIVGACEWAIKGRRYRNYTGFDCLRDIRNWWKEILRPTYYTD